MEQNVKNVVLSTSFTRPSDTTTYAAEDSVNATGGVTTCITFDVADGFDITTGMSLQIKTAILRTNSTTTTNGSFRLNLYDQSVSGFVDNSPFPMLWANREKKVGYIDFTLATGGSGSDSAEAIVTDVNISVRTEATNIFGILIAKAAYVPTSAQQFYLELNAFGIDT